MVTKEKDEELALFLELRRRQKEREKHKLLLLHDSDAPDGPPGTNPSSSPISKIVSSMPLPRTAAERFLYSEKEKSDYDWLITPPGTPLFPSLEMEPLGSQLGMSNVRPTALKSRLTNVQEEPISRTNVASKRTAVPSGLKPSSNGSRRPSSSGGPTSARPATPTRQPILHTTAKPSRPLTPTLRATLPSAKSVAPPVRSLTPTRAIAHSSTPTARPSDVASKSTLRSATPTRLPSATLSAPDASAPSVRSSARSSTPTARPSDVASKSTLRSATPTRLPSATYSAPDASAPSVRSSSVTKTVSTASKNPVQPRGSSPTVKSRPWTPNEIPGFSLDAPPNLRTSLTERPPSATRGRPASASRSRPGGASAQASSIGLGSNTRQRQQSSSPTRGRNSNGIQTGTMISVLAKSRTKTNGSDDVNPVVMGTKMVERVVNMRKLASPVVDNHHSSHNFSAGKPTSVDSSGFGSNLSKKSLDMALRHLDIRRNVSGNLRPIMTNVPVSSMYTVRSGGSTKSRTVSLSDSPLATSSNASSSEPSVNNNSYFSDGRELD